MNIMLFSARLETKDRKTHLLRLHLLCLHLLRLHLPVKSDVEASVNSDSPPRLVHGELVASFI